MEIFGKEKFFRESPILFEGCPGNDETTALNADPFPSGNFRHEFIEFNEIVAPSQNIILVVDAQCAAEDMFAPGKGGLDAREKIAVDINVAVQKDKKIPPGHVCSPVPRYSGTGFLPEVDNPYLREACLDRGVKLTRGAVHDDDLAVSLKILVFQGCEHIENGMA